VKTVRKKPRGRLVIMPNNNPLKFFLGAVVGAVAGIAAGVFFSSKKGKQLITDGKEKAMDLYDKAAEKAADMKKMGEKEYKDFMKRKKEE